MEQTKKQVIFDPASFGTEQDAELVKMYEDTLKDFSEGSIVVGRVLELRKNDVLIDIGYKSEGIVPIAEFDKQPDVAVGDAVEVLLERLEDDEGMVVVSKKRAELQRNWDRVVSEHGENSIIRGVVKARVKGGLIVDIGVDAFLPGSQVDVVPVRNPDDYIGNEYDFKLLKINTERRNIVLSRRELLEDQRRTQKKELLQEIQVGQRRTGIVKNITDFGAFVDLNGMDGLLHITDMSWGRINHPSEMLSIGDPVEVVVLDVNMERERISLGLKQKDDNPWDGIDGRYPVGTRIRGKVVNLMPYGAFVEIEPGVEGMVHVSEMSWTKRVVRASDALSIGDEVDAVILSINKDDHKISLGMRQTESNPWEQAQEKYPIGARVSGKVRNFTSYGAFVELEEGIDGMIHVSDMSWVKKINHPSEVLQKGQEVECVVLEVDAGSQRISLGLKQAQEDPWASLAAKYKVGQLVKGKVTKLTTFGGFVELEEGIDGLVHISQISDDRIQNVKDALKPGMEVEARVIKIDIGERRIGLSMKAAKIPDEEFEIDDDMLQGLRPGEDLVDLAGAFDEAFSGLEVSTEEWHPGDK